VFDDEAPGMRMRVRGEDEGEDEGEQTAHCCTSGLRTHVWTLKRNQDPVSVSHGLPPSGRHADLSKDEL